MAIPQNYFRAIARGIEIFRNSNPWVQSFYVLWPAQGQDYGIEPNNTARLQFRLYEGAPGDPLLAVTTEGGASKLEMTRNSVTAQISNEDLKKLPVSSEPGTPATLYYDLVVNTPRGEQISFYGTATVRGSSR